MAPCRRFTGRRQRLDRLAGALQGLENNGKCGGGNGGGGDVQGRRRTTATRCWRICVVPCARYRRRSGATLPSVASRRTTRPRSWWPSGSWPTSSAAAGSSATGPWGGDGRRLAVAGALWGQRQGAACGGLAGDATQGARPCGQACLRVESAATRSRHPACAGATSETTHGSDRRPRSGAAPDTSPC